MKWSEKMKKLATALAAVGALVALSGCVDPYYGGSYGASVYGSPNGASGYGYYRYGTPYGYRNYNYNGSGYSNNGYRYRYRDPYYDRRY